MPVEPEKLKIIEQVSSDRHGSVKEKPVEVKQLVIEKKPKIQNKAKPNLMVDKDITWIKSQVLEIQSKLTTFAMQFDLENLQKLASNIMLEMKLIRQE